jgi:hypothetical protein
MRSVLPPGPARAPLAAAALAAFLAAAPAARAAEDPKPAPPEPRVQEIVQEDEHVKVDELRVAGQTQTVTVQPKGTAAKPYEIVTSTHGRDLGSAAEGRRGAVGQRVWSVFGF